MRRWSDILIDRRCPTKLIVDWDQVTKAVTALSDRKDAESLEIQRIIAQAPKAEGG